ncbi:hypothetical protein N1851_022543 [Merluccius polli]|uniref:Uncharacterized protein n=1 Tax=Merluccius polli TaxID=89951 RepID=A0AA47NYE0_MERPO|nr:hypothetical protein N1851_022543 [Merluccius polli]
MALFYFMDLELSTVAYEYKMKGVEEVKYMRGEEERVNARNQENLEKSSVQYRGKLHKEVSGANANKTNIHTSESQQEFFRMLDEKIEKGWNRASQRKGKQALVMELFRPWRCKNMGSDRKEPIIIDIFFILIQIIVTVFHCSDALLALLALSFCIYQLSFSPATTTPSLPQLNRFITAHGGIITSHHVEQGVNQRLPLGQYSSKTGGDDARVKRATPWGPRQRTTIQEETEGEKKKRG